MKLQESILLVPRIAPFSKMWSRQSKIHFQLLTLTDLKSNYHIVMNSPPWKY